MRSARQRIRLCLLLASALCAHIPALAANGVEFIGRWTPPPDAPVATWAGSGVLLRFSESAFVAADLTVARTAGKAPPDGKLYISIAVDGGERRRIGLDRGFHPGFVLATALSAGVHTVELRDENEPYFGALQFAHPTLAPGGKWNKIVHPPPIVEVIGDSDATGICALGPLSPASPANLFTAAWASQSDSWPARLATKAAAAGHPIEVVDLAISGSTTGSEAEKYDQAAPYFSEQRFAAYSGHRPISLALLWGGINDHHHGGDLATETQVSVANLSPFQRGVYDQITKIFGRSPQARIGLLEYVDPVFGTPDWKPAYMQVESLFPESKRKQMFFLAVNDPPGTSNACDVDPKGHPSIAMHEAWAAQIFSFLLANNLVP